MSFTPSKKRKVILYWAIALVVVGIAGGFVAWPRAKVLYRQWSAQGHVRKAAESLAQRDFRHAILSAKNALERDPLDAGATRIMAKSLEAIGAPEAEQWRARLDTLQPGDADNVLARARAALKASGPDAAEQLVNSLEPAVRNSAAYYAVAATIAMEKRDAASAEAHWIEAVRLEPAESRHRLNLASVRLESRMPGVHEAALVALQELRSEPVAGMEALRLLLADAVRSREVNRTRELADALVADARATFNDKLARLTALRVIRDARSVPYLLELRDAAVSAPADFFTLLMWMNSKDLSLMVAEWIRWMPPELVSKPPVCLAVAEAHLRNRDWQKLEETTGPAKWAEMEYMRRAFLSRALEQLDEGDESAKEWIEAGKAARGRYDAQERLIRFAMQAKWDKRAEENMWALSAVPQCPRWVLDSLWQIAYRREDTSQLQKLSGALVKRDPKGIAARNNYAFLSLLTRNDEDNPHRIVENLYRENPGNAVVASTYGLSLFQRGKADEAVALLAALKPEDLRQPQVALYYAIFLIANGHTEKADEYLDLCANWQMLPEEKALLDRVKATNLKEPATPKAPAGERQ